MWKVTRKFIMLKLLNGISYGKDCLIVVVKPIENKGIYAGNPARLLRIL